MSSKTPRAGGSGEIAGTPPQDLYQISDIRFVMKEVNQLETKFDYVDRDVKELRVDMKDARDRLVRIEEQIKHLPTKGFIILVVTTALAICGGLLTIAPKLQSFFGTAVATGASVPQPNGAGMIPPRSH